MTSIGCRDKNGEKIKEQIINPLLLVLKENIFKIADSIKDFDNATNYLLLNEIRGDITNGTLSREVIKNLSGKFSLSSTQ